MPISLDLDHLTGPFRSIGRFQLTPIAEIFERLGKWLEDRVKKIDLLDQATRDFPVINFYNEAVALWLDPIQRGALSPDGNPPGFGDQMRAAGNAFVAGLKRIPEAYENEQIIPRFLGTLKAAVGAILDSVVRFENPSKEMFDPRLRTASDLFGEAALAFRAFASSRFQLIIFLFAEAGPAYKELTRPEPGQQAAPSEGRSFPEMLDAISRYVLGALLILPQLPGLAVGVWNSLTLFIKATTIESLRAKEEKVFGVRRTLLNLFYVDVAKLLLKALSFAAVAGFIVTRQVAFWVDFARLYGQRFLKAIADFGNALTKYVYDLVKHIEDLIASIDKILNMDLTPYLMGIVGAIPDFVTSMTAPMPKLTLLDLITGAGREQLVKWIEEVRAAVDAISPSVLLSYPIDVRLDALAEVVNIAFSPLPPKRDDTAKPAIPAAFPSIYDAWFKNASAAAIQSSFANLAATLPDQVSGIVDTASGAIERIGYQFDNASDAAARGIPIQELSAISNRAATLADQVFGADAQDLQKKIEAGHKGVAAASFQSWFAAGGFQLLASFLPQYIGAMLDVFRKQEEKGEELTVQITKTSPHILAQRAKLTRTHMKRLGIDARGRDLSDVLVQQIAVAFRGGVDGSYVLGLKQIHDVANPPNSLMMA